MIEKYHDLVDMLRHSVTKYGPRNALAEKKAGRWEWITYEEFGEMVEACRGGLAGKGIKKGDVVAIIAPNSIAWAVSAYATYGLGGRFVPMYESVLQNADPSDKWLTKSVETLSETKTGTGVTWVRGVGPDENQNMVKANPSNGAVEQLHGYGKY